MSKNPDTRAAEAKAKAERREKRRLVCDLKLRGFTFEQIARQLNYKNKSTPKRIYDEAMRAIDQPRAEQLRKQYDLRTESALRTAFAVMAKEDVESKTKLEAAKTVASIERDRAKVLGFEQPTQVRHGGAANAPPVQVGVVDYGDLARMSDEELAEAVERAAARARSVTAGLAAAAAAAGDGAEEADEAEDGGGAG